MFKIQYSEREALIKHINKYKFDITKFEIYIGIQVLDIKKVM